MAIAPLAASNGVGNLSKELAYARANGLSGLTLVNGTKAFSPNIVGAIVGVAERRLRGRMAARIVTLPGDGIGPEILASARRAARRAR